MTSFEYLNLSLCGKCAEFATEREIHPSLEFYGWCATLLAQTRSSCSGEQPGLGLTLTYCPLKMIHTMTPRKTVSVLLKTTKMSRDSGQHCHLVKRARPDSLSPNIRSCAHAPVRISAGRPPWDLQQRAPFTSTHCGQKMQAHLLIGQTECWFRGWAPGQTCISGACEI